MLSNPEGVMRHVPGFYKCGVCRIVFLLELFLKNHKCIQYKQIRSVLEIDVAVQRYFNEYNVNPSDERTEFCNICEKYYSSDEINDHKRLMHPISKLHACRDCNETFTSTSEFDTHIKAHQKRQFQCNNCKALFTKACQLRIHQLKHSAGLPYECDQCNTAFTCFFTNAEHEIICVKKVTKNYRCLICGQSYFFISNMIKHGMICNHDTPFSCNECMNSFATKSNLDNHRCAQNIPFACPNCDSLFMRWPLLLQHQKEHF